MVIREYLDRYRTFPKYSTNRLINEEPIIAFGRSAQDILVSISPLVLGVAFGEPQWGLGGCITCVVMLPYLKKHFPPGFAAHLPWSWGIKTQRGNRLPFPPQKTPRQYWGPGHEDRTP